MVNLWHLARKRKWFEWWVVKGWLTWINLGADKLQHNISCPYAIIDGIQMLQHSLFEILFDLIPHCHHSSDLELQWFLCMHCQCGLYQILTGFRWISKVRTIFRSTPINIIWYISNESTRATKNLLPWKHIPSTISKQFHCLHCLFLLVHK